MTYGDNHIMAYYGQHRSRLPSGYREVEYLQSSGAQWIDTGQTCDYYSVFECTVMHTGNETDKRNFGCRDSGYNGGFTFGVFAGIWQFGTSREKATVSQTLNVRHSVVFGREVYYDGVKVKTYNVNKWAGKYNFFIFALNDTGSVGQYSRFRLYGDSLLRSSDVAQRKLVPCVRTSDNKPGLYDLCGSICPLSGTSFYINSGSGADFTWGELP